MTIPTMRRDISTPVSGCLALRGVSVLASAGVKARGLRITVQCLIQEVRGRSASTYGRRALVARGIAIGAGTAFALCQVALQRAIEVYLAHRPELKREHMAGRSFEEAAQILQTDLFEKQAVHATQQDIRRRPNTGTLASRCRRQSAHACLSPVSAVGPRGPTIIIPFLPRRRTDGSGDVPEHRTCAPRRAMVLRALTLLCAYNSFELCRCQCVWFTPR